MFSAIVGLVSVIFLVKLTRITRFFCIQAAEEADADIINTSIEIAQHNKTVIVVGQDIDLLVLLNQLNSNNYNIYFHKPGSGNVKDLFYTVLTINPSKVS